MVKIIKIQIFVVAFKMVRNVQGQLHLSGIQFNKNQIVVKELKCNHIPKGYWTLHHSVSW